MSYLKEQFSLKNKTALITGGGGVLCGEIARGLLKAGAKVILWGRNMSSLETKAAELALDREINTGDISLTEVDLSVESEIVSALNSCDEFHILVNGVGGSSKRGSLTDLDINEFKAIVELNLYAGCILPSKHVAKYWIEKNISGSIINIASMGSYNPLSGAWAYSGAKAAVVNQTMAMAKELAASNIRVNAIAPGFFIGKQNRKLLLNDDGSPTARGRRVLDHTPMGRFGDPAELAGTVIFLAGNSASFVSGITIPVDGAYLCDNI